MLQRICQVLVALWLFLNAPGALAACIPASPVANDTVTCSGTDSTGFDGSAVDGLTVIVTDGAILDESDASFDSAIRIRNDGTVTIGAVDETVQINVTQDDGFGIRGENDNFINNFGTITIDGADGRGISILDNTTGVQPNGAVNSFEIFALGDRSIAMETGLNSGVATSGLLEISGFESRGISAANHADASIAADITNLGTINVIGDGAYGIKAGDGWVAGTTTMGVFVPSGSGIRNLSGTATINVSGANAFGIFAGDETNSSNNNNSFVTNTGTIDVTGTGAIGVSLGGNDLLDRFVLFAGSSLDVYSLENSGRILGDADSGPLVEFRSFVAGKENRIRITAGGSILAELTNVAIRGSDGDELILNAGEIRGNIEFNGGDDRYAHSVDATLNGTLFGGPGNDQLILFGASGSDSFNVSMLVDFEGILIVDGAGWELTNTAGFNGTTEISTDGRLRVPLPLTLEGDFIAGSTGTLEVTLAGTTTPLTIEGRANFDGTLIVDPDPSLTPSATPYRLIETVGGYSGRFEFSGVSGTNSFQEIYDASGLSILYQTGFVAVAQGSNQRAIAQHLEDVDSAGGASDDLQNLINEFDTSTGILANVYEALSPEVYDAQTTVIVEGGRRISNLLLNRPRACTVGEIDPWRRADAKLPCHARNGSPWLAAIGGTRDREKFSDHPRYDSSLAGLVFGIDVRPIGGLDLTFAISSQRGTLNASGAGESTVTLTDLSGHAAWTTGPLRIQGFVSWGHAFLEDRRQIRAAETTTPLDTRGNADHDSDRITAAAEIGMIFGVGPIEIEPILGVDWAWVYQRAIHEQGAGGFGIRIASRDDSIGSINGGLRLTTSYNHSRYLANWLEWMDGVWQPVVDVRWRQILDGDERDIDARFQGSPDVVSDFTITGREDHGGFEIGAGISFIPRHANRLQFDLRYDAFVASHTLEQSLVAKVLIGF